MKLKHKKRRRRVQGAAGPMLSRYAVPRGFAHARTLTTLKDVLAAQIPVTKNLKF